MIRRSVGLWVLTLIIYHTSYSQVDTSYVYKTGLPYGTLDIRLATSSTRYYFLQEGKTFSFRESAPGVKTDTYKDETSWDSSPYTQGNMRLKNGTSDQFVMNYRLLPPSNYNASYADGYPLIVMLHGAGERANCWDATCFWSDKNWRPYPNTPAAPTTSNHDLLNNDLNLVHGGNEHLQARNLAGTRLPNDPSMPDRAFPGFVLYPQNLNGWDTNSLQDAIRLIRLVTKKYKIDQNRIYIHGLSNGGQAVYDALKHAPWLFAAALPMSAISESGIITYGLTEEVANIPLWVFQGGIDTNPSPGKTDGYVKKFREAGFSIRYTKYANLGHGVWNTAYAEPDFFTWMRSKSKSDIHVFADNPVLCQTTGKGVQLELAAGFLAYQWEKDGAIIAGANGPVYTATATGTYRARFSRQSKTPSEAQWNTWSKPVTVGTTNPSQAQLAQIGSVVLKDLNYYNNAQLTSVKTDDHYYWYKDGTLMNLSGDQDDTTRTVLLRAGDCSSGTCAGNGVYTLVTAAFNNCPTPVSAPIHVYFNDQAPINITAPTSFTADNIGLTQATLHWNDLSTNEGGFEVWRRKVTSPASPYVLGTITGPNVTSYTDTALDPSATYQFKIRAVSASGRSNYYPAASNQYLVVNTQTDTSNPSVPQNLVATNTGIQEIRLSWQGATDNTGVKSYNIYYGSTMVNTGNNATSYTLKGLPLNTTFTFTVRAVDLGGNLSGSSNSSTADTYVNGLYYKHTTGAWNDIDAVDWSIAEFTGKVNNFTLAPRTQEDYFNFQFEGFLYITTAGNYQFRTTSDDGSRLTLNNTVIVDNDGIHGNVTVTSAAVALAAGAQTINVKYIEYTGGQNLVVQYMGPDTGGSWVNIPDAALSSGSSTSTPPDDTAMTGLDYRYVTGTWSDLDAIDWSSASTGHVTNFTLTPATQGDHFAFQFDGFLYINTAGNYQFRTTSDDGSKLMLNNNTIVDNDGLHANVTITSASIALAAGSQTINVKYLEYTGGQNLVVQYMGPDTGGSWVNIPDGALHNGTTSTPPSGDPYVTGLDYKFATGQWNNTDVIDWSNARTGHVTNITLAPATQGDYFAFQFDGYLYITNAGSYQFRTTSDDGSKLTLNNATVVDNDGLHGTRTITSATIALTAGAQTISVKYIEYTGGQNLTVEYLGPDTGGSWVTIPDGVLHNENPNATARMASTDESQPKTDVMTKLERATLYPNPLSVGRPIHMKLDDAMDQPVHVEVMDLMGNSLYRNTFASDELLEGPELAPGVTMSKGIYLVVLRHGDTTVKKRIVVKD